MKQISKIILGIICLGLLSFNISNNTFKIGEEAPAFTLKNIDGNMVSLNDYSDTKGVIVVFTCNHCPFAKAYEQRIIDLHKKYEGTYPVVAINANDPQNYPEDSFKGMQKRAKQKGYPFPYLHDETQEVAKAYGASKTPEIFLLEKIGDKYILKYKGTIDDNYEDGEKAKEKYVENAIASLEKGQAPSPAETRAVGCSIKWKK